MKHKASLILASLAMVFSCGLIGGVHSNKEKVEEAAAYYTPSTHYEVSDTASELASYYSSISDSDTGTSLLSKLQSLNSTKRKKTMGYSGIGTSTSGAVIYTDYDLNNTAKDSNGQTYGTKVASFYTKTAATSWNREHVWPDSHGGNQVEGDILHTRPTISSENSSRGNSFYVEGKNHSADGWDPYTAGYDIECRGECARIILYSVVASSSLNLAAVDKITSGQSGYSNTMGNMNTLIKWHFDYAPSVYEMNRNNGAEYLQGNRNPFVDHPEYVARIWSSFNSTVTSLCNQNSSKYSNWNAGSYCDYGSNTPSHTLEGVAISASTAKVINGSTTTLSATASNNGSISWTTSNSSVASISSSSSASGANITITGRSVGTATITASCTINGTTYSPTCTVAVLASKQVSSIALSGQKTKFNIGDTFTFGGTVTATYNDDTEEDVTASASFSGYDLTSTGEQTVTVNYTYGVSVSTTYKITVSSGSSGSTDYELYSGSITEGNYLIVYDNKAMTNTVSSDRLGYTAVSPSNNVISNSDASLIWHIEQSGSYWTIYNESVEKYAASTGAKNKAQLLASGTDNKSLWSVSGTSTYEFVNKQNSSNSVNANLRENGTYGYACYSTSTGGSLSLYKQKSSTPVTLSSIEVSTAPTKTTYTVGECFDPTGLVITRNYSDSTSDTYTYANHTSDFGFTPSTSTALTTGNTSVTITYGGKSTSQAITVNAAKTLSSIAVSTAPTKTSYYAGQTFDPTGLVIRRNYSDSTYDTYTYSGHTSEFTFSPSTSTSLTTENTSVTITYGGKSTTQSITVQSVTLSSITVSTSPTKTSYIVDECFDPTGLVITRNYSNSTSDTYTYAGHTSEFTFNPSTITPLTTENTSVTITYGGKSCSQSITVSTSGGGGSTESGTFNQTYSYNDLSNWSVSNTGSASGYVLCPNSNSSTSIALFEGIFTDKTITSTVVVTINCATYGSGGSPTTDTFKIYSNSSCTSLVSSTQTGTLPSSNSYTNVIYTVSQVNAQSFVDDLAILITKPGRQIRLKTVTIVFDYEESSGSTEDPTSISATVSKTFYVGETISTSDISVKDNNNKTVSSFTFVNDGYQFTYADAPSGGASASKTFTNAISGANLTCSLTVQVQRKAYAAPSSGSITLTSSSVFNNIGGGNNSLKNGTVTSGGVVYEYYQSYYYSGGSSLSFGNASSQTGYLTNQTAFTYGISDVTVTSSGRAVNVRYSEDGSNWVLKSSATPASKTYQYFKIDCIGNTGSNYSNITVVSITTKPVETANNVANYVMYEDTNNQCTTKLSVAIGYLSNCSQAELTTFQTSTDYVISTGRERLEAWARNQGKSINYTAGNVTLGNQVLPTIEKLSVNNTTMIIIIVSIVGVASIGGYFFLKKRKED